ncbi:MAG: hypothetical protein RL198_178 [Actinomycetota bacterium]
MIGNWAFFAALIGPFQNVIGWTLAAALWPGFDPITRTISDLAADDSPVKWVQTSFFIFGSTLTLLAAWDARSLPLSGRLTLFFAGLASFGFTIFATPSQDSYSWPHRIFASIAFLLFSLWPLLAMRRNPNLHWSLRPVGAIPATLVMFATTGWFLLTWLEPDQSLVGLSERVIAVMQVLWLSAVILLQRRFERRASRL